MKINFSILILLLLSTLGFPRAVFGQSVASSFNPPAVATSSGQDFAVDVRLNSTATLKVRMYQLNMNFDTSKVQVKSINYKVGTKSDVLRGDGNENLDIINSSGQIKLIGELAIASPFTLSQGVATPFVELVFTSSSSDQYNVNILSTSFLKNVKSDLSLETISISASSMTVNQAAPPVPAATACFFMDDKPIIGNSCTDVGARVYDIHPKIEPLILTTAGKKTIFVRFISNLGATKDFQRVINFNPDPKLTEVSCAHSLSGSGSVITINGTALGSRGKGKVKVDGADANIITWNEQSGVITASLDKRLEGKSDVELTRDDGKTVGAECTVGTTSVLFTAQTQCKSGGNFAADNVSVKIFANAPAAIDAEKPEPVIDQKIKLDKDGKPSGFAPKLEKDKKYSLIVKAPGTLSKRIDFETKGGTRNLDSATLLVGDIAPATNPDGKINAFDRSELIRQWSLVRDVQRSGDFNQDGRVNSIDYACMRQNINQSDEEFSPSAPSPSPVVSPSASPTATPSATPVPTPSATPSGILPFRVSFDPNFTTIVASGDMGSGTIFTLDLTLIGGPGLKSVYVQFFEDGVWGPTPPQTSSILLL